MSIKKRMIPLLVCVLLLCACDYIILPEDLDEPGGSGSGAWSAQATNVTTSEAGDLHVDLTIRNETGDWSAMQATANKPAVLTTGDGKTTACDTLYVSTGGHRLAPGFQMRAYTAGTKGQQAAQPIYVECKGAQAAPGTTLSFDYNYVTGQYNYYYPDANQVDTTLEVSLDEVVTDLEYPIAEPVEGLIRPADAELVALNDVVLLLSAVQRTDTGLQFTWQTSNPGEYPSYVHIGNPPVIGADGTLYGYYETPDIVSVPITPAGDKAEWTTEVAVPQEATGLYILLSVESGKQRLFANYAINISDR